MQQIHPLLIIVYYSMRSCSGFLSDCLNADRWLTVSNSLLASAIFLILFRASNQGIN